MRAYAGDGATDEDLSPAVLDQLRRLGNLLFCSVRDDAFAGREMRSLSTVAEYLRQGMADLRREQFRVLHLDGDNRLLADRVMWSGTVNMVQVHPREVVRDVLETGALAIILAHNHPSGASNPSNEDLSVTRKIEELCSCLDVIVQDHVIVGRQGIFSMRACGMLGSTGDARAEDQRRSAASRRAGLAVRPTVSAAANALASPTGDFGTEPHSGAARIVQARLVAQSALRLRRRRERVLGGQLFAEPAWDMLLDLYVRQSEDLRTTISGACIGAAAPATTALRYLAALEQRGLVERHASPGDGRVQLIRLGERAFEEMTTLLADDVVYRHGS